MMICLKKRFSAENNIVTAKETVYAITVKLRYNEIHGDREKFRCSENFVVAEKSVNKENRAGV